MAYIIGIDIGTSGTKTVLFDEAGKVIASKTIEYPMYQPQNGYAEQDPKDWADAVINTIKAVMTISGVNKEDVKGIGLSGQMHGLVMLDKQNEVIRRSIIWCDQRTANEVDQMNELLGREKLIEITANPALTGWTAAKILWVKNNEPENYERCRHILLPKDYIRFVLTHEYATEVSDASGMQLLNIAQRDWSDEVIDGLGLDKTMLGKVYESCEVTGRLTKRMAELTGLCEGTPVVGGRQGVYNHRHIGSCVRSHIKDAHRQARQSPHMLCGRSRMLARNGRYTGRGTFTQVVQGQLLQR